MEETKEYVRDWLNEDTSMTGSIMTRHELTKSSEGKFYHWANIEIRDCSRGITLDFCVTDEKDKITALNKLEIIETHIRSLKSKIESMDISRII